MPDKPVQDSIDEPKDESIVETDDTGNESDFELSAKDRAALHKQIKETLIEYTNEPVCQDVQPKQRK